MGFQVPRHRPATLVAVCWVVCTGLSPWGQLHLGGESWKLPASQPLHSSQDDPAQPGLTGNLSFSAPPWQNPAKDGKAACYPFSLPPSLTFLGKKEVTRDLCYSYIMLGT